MEWWPQGFTPRKDPKVREGGTLEPREPGEALTAPPLLPGNAAALRHPLVTTLFPLFSFKDFIYLLERELTSRSGGEGKGRGRNRLPTSQAGTPM